MLHAYYMVQSLANKWFGLDVLQSPYVHLEQTAHAMLSLFQVARFRVTRGHAPPASATRPGIAIFYM